METQNHCFQSSPPSETSRIIHKFPYFFYVLDMYTIMKKLILFCFVFIGLDWLDNDFEISSCIYSLFCVYFLLLEQVLQIYFEICIWFVVRSLFYVLMFVLLFFVNIVFLYVSLGRVEGLSDARFPLHNRNQNRTLVETSGISLLIWFQNVFLRTCWKFKLLFRNNTSIFKKSVSWVSSKYKIFYINFKINSIKIEKIQNIQISKLIL